MVSLEDGMSVYRSIVGQRIKIYEPNFDITPTINPRPDTQHILTTPHTQYSSTNLLTGLSELIAYNCQQQVFPVSVRDTFLQPDDPFAASLILIVFPNWPDALLENVII